MTKNSPLAVLAFVAGWMAFVAAFLVEDSQLKALLLVAARALP